MQRTIALKWMGSKGIKSLHEVACHKGQTVGEVQSERVLLLTVPTTKKLTGAVESLGLKSSNTYVITLVPGPIEQMIIDPLLAVAHIKGINKVVFHAGSEGGQKVIDKIWTHREQIRLHDVKMLRLDEKVKI